MQITNPIHPTNYKSDLRLHENIFQSLKILISDLAESDSNPDVYEVANV